MLTVKVNIDGLQYKMKTLAINASELDKPLRKFGMYLRKKAIARYKAQDFAPLAKSTLDKRAEKGIRDLERKLHRDVKRAVARAQEKSVTARSFLDKILSTPSMAAEAAQTKGVKNRLAVLAAFKAQHRRPGDTLAQRQDLKPLTLKQHQSLASRETRAVAKAVGKPILGLLPRTLMVEVRRGNVTLISRTHQEFTDVHNQGGSAGHGAKIPKRETVKLEAQDLEVLGEIIREHCLAAFDK